MRTIYDFDLHKCNGEQIILYGAGSDGYVVAGGLVRSGVEDFLFCDRSPSYKEKLVFGKKVISPGELCRYPTANILITSSKYNSEIYRDLKRMGYDDEKIFFPTSLWLQGQNEKRGTSFQDVLKRYSYVSSRARLLAEMNQGQYLPILYIMVTEKCSLRCSACFNLMPLYHNPQNISLSVSIAAIKYLLDAGYYISTVCLSGGEPFLNQEFMKGFLKEYKKDQRIGCFQTITNATVPIREETAQIMGDTGRMYAIFSNYDVLSKNLSQNVEMLQKYDVGTAVEQEEDITMKNGTLWIDYGEVKHYHYPMETVQKMFDSCVNAKGCTTLLNGKLYICGHIANGVNLGLIPDGPRLYVELSENTVRQNGIKNIRESCHALLNDTLYSPGCEYCNRCAGNLAQRARQLKVAGNISS